MRKHDRVSNVLHVSWLYASEQEMRIWEIYLHAHESLRTTCKTTRNHHAHGCDAYTYLVVLSWLWRR